MRFITEIIQNTPTWVWILLAVLAALGAMQMCERTVKRFTVLIAPIALLMVGLFASPRPAYAFAWWVAAFALMLLFGFKRGRVRSGVRYLPESDALSMPGSVLPMIVMLAIFMISYMLNIAFALKPTLRGDAMVQSIAAVMLGALSGLFLARALRLFRLNNA